MNHIPSVALARMIMRWADNCAFGGLPPLLEQPVPRLNAFAGSTPASYLYYRRIDAIARGETWVP